MTFDIFLDGFKILEKPTLCEEAQFKTQRTIEEGRET